MTMIKDGDLATKVLVDEPGTAQANVESLVALEGLECVVERALMVVIAMCCRVIHTCASCRHVRTKQSRRI